MKYTHDCENCIPLGEYFKNDLYFCVQGGSSPTVIARFGNSGWQYTSGLALVKLDPRLFETLNRAKSMRLIE